MPFSMIEALSRGIGVVASALPGQLYVGRDLGAVRFTPLDPGALAAAWPDLLARDAATVVADADAAHPAIAGSMDLEDWARQLIDRYRRHAQVLPPDDRSPSMSRKFGERRIDKGKPVARRGRKVTGPSRPAGLPKGVFHGWSGGSRRCSSWELPR